MANGDRSGSDPDMLEGGANSRLIGRAGRWDLGVAAAVLLGVLVGVLVGYAVGRHHAPARTVQSSAMMPSVTHRVRSELPAFGPPLAQTGATCSRQHGHRLQLGIEIENTSASIVHITRVGTRVLVRRPLTSRVGTCGEIRGSPVSFDPSALTQGAATWLTATVADPVRCRAPYPVRFVVRYDQGGVVNVETIAGLIDLSHVSYAGCPHTQ